MRRPSEFAFNLLNAVQKVMISEDTMSRELDSRLIAIDTAERVGPAVMHASLSTFLAISVLSTGVSFIAITIFRVLAACVGCAVLFGGVWLPILLGESNRHSN